jgi:hypothetical protein
MKPEDEKPQRVWQSLDREGEPEMEMRLTTDELCAMAHYRERENVYLQWIVSVVCLGVGAALVYGAIAIDQLWLRLAQTWMALLMALAIWGVRSWGARRIQPGESCAHFMVRELEGSRRTLLVTQWGIVLVLPGMAMVWWGANGVMRAALHLDPTSWRYYFPTSPWPFVAVLPVFLACWAGLGLEAKKRARQAEELRRAIGG